jgi:hypothetical protein
VGPTNTPNPTNTTGPTNTPNPTNTTAPTNTPAATNTAGPSPTATNTPTATATSNPLTPTPPSTATTTPGTPGATATGTPPTATATATATGSPGTPTASPTVSTTPAGSPTATPTEGPLVFDLFEGWTLPWPPDFDGWPGPTLSDGQDDALRGGDEITAFFDANVDPNVWEALAVYDPDTELWGQHFNDPPLPAFQTLGTINPGDDLWIFATTDATLTIP